MAKSIVRHTDGTYQVKGKVSGKELVEAALHEITRVFENKGNKFERPEEVKRYLSVQLGLEQREVFSVMFLDSQHQLIHYERLFLGTINQSEVHPREVVKRCLELNSAAVIVAHNHPSGVSEPSQADRLITDKLVKALKLIEVKVLDHIVVGGSDTYSFAERGLL